MLLFGILFAYMGYASAQDANCDFSQQITPGVTYTVNSPNYPNSYPRNVQCRWIAYCPSGYNCKLDCSEINLPNTPSCTMDRLLISKSGDPQLTSAERYCGYGTLSAVSTGQTLSIGLITSAQSTGGRFACTLTAVAASGGSCSCGYRKTNRIVGGVETGVNEFPSMAGVVYGNIQQIKCGGVIISPRHILTAAHCVVNEPVSNLAVIVGEHNINTGGDTSATQAFRVSSATVHPLYSSNNYDYDMAVLTLSGDIRYSDRVGPVCLPFKFVNSDLTGASLIALGWGTIFTGGPTSDYLQKVNLYMISQSTCQQSIPSLTPRQFCTYNQGKDTCQDDSGGPLLYSDPSTGLLFNVGIISYGKVCASKTPSVNTRVTALLTWIQNVTPGVNYCVK